MTAYPSASLSVLRRQLDDDELKCHWLAGDGSDRSYFRVTLRDESTLVLMQLSDSDCAKLRAGKYEWLLLAGLLREQGLKVPNLVKSIPELNAIIIEDYGDVMLQDRVTQLLVEGQFAKVEEYYLKCADSIVSLLKVPQSAADRWLDRSFDYDKLHWELSFFVENYLRPVFETSLSEAMLSVIQNEIGQIAKFTSSYSKYFVHRDFHSRNVMLLDDDVAIIDFQDARTGPSTYDVVSLVFDSYVPLSGSQRRQILAAVSSRIKSSFDHSFQRQYDEQLAAVLLQRQLKAIGSFGYLTIKKNKGNYLKYVRPAVQTLIEFSVFDERWPFISGKLLELIQNRVVETK
jgi:aminoglycoside/choline kinase family phosphotransferase